MKLDERRRAVRRSSPATLSRFQTRLAVPGATYECGTSRSRDEIAESASISGSSIGRTGVREYVTIHDSQIGDGCRLYERSSFKTCTVDDEVDIDMGTYVENATTGSNV